MMVYVEHDFNEPNLVGLVTDPAGLEGPVEVGQMVRFQQVDGDETVFQYGVVTSTEDQGDQLLVRCDPVGRPPRRR